jgi:hypothetical protein
LSVEGWARWVGGGAEAWWNSKRMFAKQRSIQSVLWLDCVSGAVAGCFVLLLAGWLSRLYRIPEELVWGNGVVNLVYACFSLSLAVWRSRPVALIGLLAVANASWLVVCFAAVFWLGGEASVFGIGHLVFEGLYVGWLAQLEWGLRKQS